MASTRSRRPARRSAPAPPTGTPSATFRAFLQQGARVPIAAATTTATTLRGWAETTDWFTQTVADELLRRVDGESDSAELAARITAAGSTHLRELVALPRAAVNTFDSRIARASTNHKEVR
jgi:hypothetical protein